jgi:hypothetical protein
VSEVEARLVAHASSMKLPDEKAARMMKSMLQRAKAWVGRVTKALPPVPGEAQPYDLDALKDLAHAGDDIPLCMPLESRLLTVIEDRGVRHCICGGPSDGRFMVSCVNISKEDSDGLDVWKRPLCEGNTADVCSLRLGKFHENYVVDTDTVLFGSANFMKIMLSTLTPTILTARNLRRTRRRKLLRICGHRMCCSGPKRRWRK